MATTRCFVYKELQKTPIDLDPENTLDQIRSVLSATGIMTPEWGFYYLNPITSENEALPASSEGHVKLSVIIDSSNQLTIINTHATRPDFFGTIAHWFTDRNMQVSVGLNWEDNAKPVNKDKFAPFLLTNVKSVNPAIPLNFTNAVICEKGTVIGFTISSWGAAGYGFSIKSDKITFVSSLWSVNNGQYGTVTNVGLNRYQDAQVMIQVDSTADQNIPGTDKVKYSQVRIRTWNVSGYQQGDTTYSSDLQPAQHRGGPSDPGGFQLDANAAVVPGDGVLAGAVVPGGGVSTGSPHAGGASGTNFGAPIGNVQQDDPDSATPLGEVTIYFLVFNDHATAAQVIQQQNGDNPY